MMLATVERFKTKARNGTVYSKRAPEWLAGEKGGQFVIIEERAAVVNQIYEWSASGMGAQAIAKRLNDTVTPWTKGHKRGDQWKLGYVRDILSSPSVEGEWHVKSGIERIPTGEVIECYYARVSTTDQSNSIQTDTLTQHGVERLFEEQQSGKAADNRPILQQCLDFVREGDVLVVTRLDRIARSARDLHNVIHSPMKQF